MGTKISQLNIQTPLDGTEYVECIISPYTPGTNRRITTQDIADLAGDEHFKGVYASEAALVLAHATAESGDYAYVDAGVGNPVELWIWDDDDSEWVQSGGAAGGTWGSITGTLSAQTDLNTALTARQLIANTATALTDGASIDITGPKHTLTSDEATITFSQSYTGDFTNIDVTLNATAATWTFPAGSLCVVEGSASGDNTATITAVSGDKIVISIWFVAASTYRVAIKNFGQ